MGRRYQQEVDYLPESIKWAVSQPTVLLSRGIHHFADRGLLPVGSGGSFTAAALAAEFHFSAFGRVSRPITPLDTFNVSSGAFANAAALLISAEGKNKDILAGARQLLTAGCPALALTLTQSNPLVELCRETGAATAVAYDMPWGKDGYLATNSLVATLVLLWKAYHPAQDVGLPQCLLQWLATFRQQLRADASRRWVKPKVLILSGTSGQVGAIDLESRLSESGFSFGQLANFRQFAHGRHLQLSEQDDSVGILAIAAANDQLADATLNRLPPSYPVFRIDLPVLPAGLTELAGVLASIEVVAAWAEAIQRDPGKPDVPQFGRDLHGLDIQTLLPLRPLVSPVAKKWPGLDSQQAAKRTRAANRFAQRLRDARFKALLCDFDGTFCDTIERYEGLAPVLVGDLVRILEAGLLVAFATGRGDSIIGELTKKLPEPLWPQVLIGCYSGSVIFPLDKPPERFPAANARFLELRDWLVRAGVVESQADCKIDCEQMGLRALPPRARQRALSAVTNWIRVEGLSGWRVFSSGHSLDVVTDKAGKRLVVVEAARRVRANVLSEVLRLGDAGDFGGNDYELLNEGISLTVDVCSSDEATCWNLLPGERRGVQGTLHYLQGLDCDNGRAKFSAEFLAITEQLLDMNGSTGSPI